MFFSFFFWKFWFSGLSRSSVTFENILSIRVLEWLVIQNGCKVKGINEFKARDSKVHLSDYAHYNSIG